MNDDSRRYLEDLKRRLEALPESDREEAVREIESHIAEGLGRGAPESAVLATLPPAAILAKAYLADYLQTKPPTAMGEIGRFGARLIFVLGTGVLSLLLGSFLALLTVAMTVLAIGSPIAGILRTFGAAPWVVIGNSHGWTLPNQWSFPVLLVLGALCAGVAWLSLQALRRYLRSVLWSYARMTQLRRLVPSSHG